MHAQHADRALGDGIEHGLDLRGRAADDGQHIGSGRLAVQRLVEGRVAVIDDQIAALREAQRRTANELATLRKTATGLFTRLDKREGHEVERRYREHATGYFGGILRRVRPHKV